MSTLCTTECGNKVHTVYSNKTDVIAAIASPQGRGAVSIIRMSGEGSAAILAELVDKKEFEHAKMIPCKFDGRIKDRIMAVVFYGSKSYTGEESVEMYFHGGKYLTEQALLSLIDKGARLAEAGEFTRRAFLNGKIDLTMAEGISDLIDGDNVQAVNYAYEQSEGRTKKAIDGIYNDLAVTAAKAEVCIDYPEEDIEEQTREKLSEELKETIENIQKEIRNYDGGRIIREGARVTLTGKVNAGKSTLFNSLLGCDRAIVSGEEGTTRDTVEEKFVYKGIAAVLTDTAGIRRTDSEAENLGIERSREAVKKSDSVILVLREGEEIPQTLDENVIVVVNFFGQPIEADGIIALNAKTGDGCDILKEEIHSRLSKLTSAAGYINNPRHYAALKNANDNLLRALESARFLTMDCVCADIRLALDSLGSITGKNSGESIINEIFSRFCVGK